MEKGYWYIMRHDIRPNDIEHEDIKHNDTRYYDTWHNDTWHNDTEHKSYKRYYSISEWKFAETYCSFS
jgi:hypothetical protein